MFVLFFASTSLREKRTLPSPLSFAVCQKSRNTAKRIFAVCKPTRTRQRTGARQSAETEHGKESNTAMDRIEHTAKKGTTAKSIKKHGKVFLTANMWAPWPRSATRRQGLTAESLPCALAVSHTAKMIFAVYFHLYTRQRIFFTFFFSLISKAFIPYMLGDIIS